MIGIRLESNAVRLTPFKKGMEMTEKKNLEPTLPPLLPETTQVMDTLMACELVKKALQLAVDQDQQCVDEQVEITEIPSSPFGEDLRGKDFVERFARYGLKDILVDEVGNVIAVRPGVGPEPRTKLVISAHLDTVFAKDSNFKVRQEGNSYYAPSIGDDSRGLAGLLQVLRMFNELNVQTIGDVIFVATVGEEGEGDLRGVKNLFRDPNVDIDGFISFDWSDPRECVVGATGSFRYRVSFDGPGGHSYLGFGLPSAIHAMFRTGETLCNLEVPKDPKTTYTVGVIKGGTTVNAIAAHASMDIDMRSTENSSLCALRDKILPCFEKAAEDENAHWGVTDEANKVKVTITPIGERPAGQQAPESPVCQAVRAGLLALGLPLNMYASTSGDHNVSLSMGIPSLCIGAGGRNYKMHTLEEVWERVDAYQGPQLAFLMVCALAGLDGVTKGILPKRAH